ncbi:folate family ECF transporter S component [Companilactobacillus halodurans]|uniref:Folate family ECF transporter S component n=1 Tax=Companilactobacillus halodurans TaxID=2584183 RepID=A0A5P0ZNG7_9LACO|nr:folate family ECF transporter S component [Companilactobacillus halodurans]MQS75764.1 folate family ECF transporter S component [Companilactobacillus halodurans]MQS98467.1 folate family ECF transporter S component [Companilactobacillus halodurans]
MNSSRSTVISVQEITWMALLIALQMVLSKLSIGSNTLKVGFSFIAIGLLGYYFGPFKAAIANVLADIISNTVLPSAGGFFWGFTFSALVAGVIYGFMLYNHKVTLWRAFVTVFLITLIVNTGLNTLWIHMMTNVPYIALLVPRLVKEAFSLIYQTGLLYIVLKWIDNSKFKKIGL